MDGLHHEGPNSGSGPTPVGIDQLDLAYSAVRDLTEELASPLSAEDQQAQSMSDASPVKWHRAHTTWFFETFILIPYVSGYQSFNADFNYLFNSYYEAVGKRQYRPERGLITRPSVSVIDDYRAHVDQAMVTFIRTLETHATKNTANVKDLIQLGLNHEQQHQELILTDLLHLLSRNATHPAYQPLLTIDRPQPLGTPEWTDFEGGLVEIGHDGQGFAFDNEGPRHKTWLNPFRLCNRLVTNQEWCEFINDGGYRDPSLWLSDGLAFIRDHEISAPLYWERSRDQWYAMTLRGFLPIVDAAPVSHISYYEADAFARWAQKRLPTEAEWEYAASDQNPEGNMLASKSLRAMPGDPTKSNMQQLFGDCWEWTASAYSPYPGFKAAAGAVGEYNGKFMCNQMVLKGGSCVTPPGHIRASYRNFFYPHHRWQFTGLRLAEDL